MERFAGSVQGDAVFMLRLKDLRVGLLTVGRYRARRMMVVRRCDTLHNDMRPLHEWPHRMKFGSGCPPVGLLESLGS